MKSVKLMKRFFTVLLIYAFVIISPFSASAADANTVNTAVKTGDNGVIWIVIAVAAFFATAFITIKLTKHNNKNIK